jgi:hypothetical protein
MPGLRTASTPKHTMTQPFDTTMLMAHSGRTQRAVVAGFSPDGVVRVQVPGQPRGLNCLVLQVGAAAPSLREGDEVLVWQDQAGTSDTGVVLGRIGLYGDSATVCSPEEFARRPRSLVLEAQEEIILRNGRARIRLGADGDIEIVGESFSSRCRRLVRLLAPMIKLN